MTSRSRHRPRRFDRLAMSRRTVTSALAALALVLICAGAVFAYQALKAQQALQLAATQAQRLQTQVSAGNATSARTTLKDLQTSTGAARARTSGPLWDAGGRVPFLGDSVTAAQTISRVLDELSHDGLQPIVDVADSVDSKAFSPKDGRIDVKAIEELTPALVAADRSLTSGRRQLADISADDVVGPLKAPVQDLKDKIATAQSAAASGATAAKVMPTMLGSDERRSFLLVFQNNAEVRSTGGLPGAFAKVEADNGKLELTGQGAGSEFGYFDEPVVKLTKDEKNLYTDLMTTFWSDANFTPDFPRTGEIMRAMYEKRFDGKVDGVFSVDPIALSYLLKATGPIELADGSTITDKNAVDLLLNEVYLKFPDDDAAQNDYFQDAAARVFEAVVAGKGDPRALLRQLSKGVSENRLLVWSGERDEQTILAQTRVSGALPSNSGATPHIGVYLNDSTATKLEYYLDHKTTMHTESCSANGVQTIDTTTVLTSTAPKGGKGLPKTILGPSKGAQNGAMRLNLRIYAPYGGEINEVSVDDELQTILSAKHHQRNVTIVPIRLKPGQTVTVRTIVLTGKGQTRDPVLSVTPTVTKSRNNIAIASACRREG